MTTTQIIQYLNLANSILAAVYGKKIQTIKILREMSKVLDDGPLTVNEGHGWSLKTCKNLVDGAEELFGHGVTGPLRTINHPLALHLEMLADLIHAGDRPETIRRAVTNLMKGATAEEIDRAVRLVYIVANPVEAPCV